MIRRTSQIVVLLIAVGLLTGLVFYIQGAIKAQASQPAPEKEQVVLHPEVSVISVSTGSYNAQITGYGSASPHFELTLAARVAGQVTTLSNTFETGKLVKKGEVIVQLDTTEYKDALAQAQKDLSDAQLALLEEERSALQAKAEWQSSGLTGEPASDLVLHGPQVAAAKAAVTAARAAVETAEADLSYTRITAPFDALVVERSVAPGSFVQAGSTIAVLYSTDRAEITVSLSAAQWSSLPDMATLNVGTWPVTLVHAQTGRQWSGYILRASRQVDDKSRQQSVIVALDEPLDSQNPLLFGTFVSVNIEGQPMSGLWELPASAFSQKGEIWYVKADNTLSSFTTQPVFSHGESIYVAPPEDIADSPRKVLIHPLNHYLDDMAVTPVQESSHE
ncbi:efflux RND transporter periplasmic adaptor subunit [uncultured Desulfobacter sp.]|uniref:efflux RND transporter periplasmic adaptor subunit n=1 Tax=uncultured Desulfobacter sp. TaxID=240139 RepID=UPI002AAC1A24|nr:efflux RND transporter periplasmic adaptor subunit [uncultured Desulfobacter sp.]